MSLGVQIAIGLGSAIVSRALFNGAFAVTTPAVDPAMPMAGPVLGAAAVPAIPAALLWKKHRYWSSALIGVAAGGAISTAEYMSYAREAQAPAPGLPAAQSYTWTVVHKDGSLDLVATDTVNLAALSAKDAQIVNKYGPDSDITMIVRKDASGNQTVLVNKNQPPSIAVGEPHPQSGAVVRLMMRR